MATRAHRCEPTEDPDELGGSDYAGAFEVTIGRGDDRSPEQWSRSVFESAPIAIRWFVVFGLAVRLGDSVWVHECHLTTCPVGEFEMFDLVSSSLRSILRS